MSVIPQEIELQQIVTQKPAQPGAKSNFLPSQVNSGPDQRVVGVFPVMLS